MQRRNEIERLLRENDVIKEDLESCSIHSLRVLAQCALVQNAVKLRKGDLIDEIMKVKEGTQVAYVSETSKGRPSRALLSINSVLNIVVNNAKVRREGYLDINVEGNNRGVLEDSNPRAFLQNDINEFKIKCNGLLEIVGKNGGYLREGYNEVNDSDVFVSSEKIDDYNLKQGDFVEGWLKQTNQDDHRLYSVEKVNGRPVSILSKRDDFSKLIPSYPDRKISLTSMDDGCNILRVIDLFSPIGFGQRSFIQCPNKFAEKEVMEVLSNGIVENNSGAKVLLLLIGERPEEATYCEVNFNGETVFTTFEEDDCEHTRVVNFVLSSAKRLVESGEDVVILVSNIQRLFYIDGQKEFGSIVKSLLGSAKNVNDGGSLTIIATMSQVQAEMQSKIISKLDDYINMKLVVSDKLFKSRAKVYVDISQSYTIMDKVLLSPLCISASNQIRATIQDNSLESGAEYLSQLMDDSVSNEELARKIVE